MSRWLPSVAGGALLALVAFAAVSLLSSGNQPSIADRADSLARELRCPDCQGLSVADSPSESAREIGRQIDEMLTAGASDDEVRAYFVDRYGDWILLAPSNPIVWIAPLLIVVAGTVALGMWLVRQRTPQAAAPVLSAEERRRLHEEVEAIDA